MVSPTTLWYLHIYGWKDILEITLFSGVIFYFSLWLKKDIQKPILLSFYGYCATITTCHFLHLPTAITALLVFAPTALVLLVILHQESFQKNFITLHSLKQTHDETVQDWIGAVIRSCLFAASNHKDLTIVIERNNSLHSLLSAHIKIRCKLQEGLIDYLISSDFFIKEQIIWINEKGALVGLNSSWQKTSLDTWLTQEVKEQAPWLQEALFFTAKTDALYLKTDSLSRTFTIITQGVVIEKISAHTAIKTLKNYLGHFEPAKKGDIYARKSQSIPEQSLS